MARLAIDISLTGDKELLKKLARLSTPAAQRKAVIPALRKSDKRLKSQVLANLSGGVVNPQTGRLLSAMAIQKVRAIPRSRSVIGVAFGLPTREELGISAEDEWYYPVALEYGHGGPHPAPPHPYMRRAVDSNRERELTAIGAEIGTNIVKQALRK